MQQKSRDGDNSLNVIFIIENVNDCEETLQKWNQRLHHRISDFFTEILNRAYVSKSIEESA